MGTCSISSGSGISIIQAGGGYGTRKGWLDIGVLIDEAVEATACRLPLLLLLKARRPSYTSDNINSSW